MDNFHQSSVAYNTTSIGHTHRQMVLSLLSSFRFLRFTQKMTSICSYFLTGFFSSILAFQTDDHEERSYIGIGGLLFR